MSPWPAARRSPRSAWPLRAGTRLRPTARRAPGRARPTVRARRRRIHPARPPPEPGARLVRAGRRGQRHLPHHRERHHPACLRAPLPRPGHRPVVDGPGGQHANRRASRRRPVGRRRPAIRARPGRRGMSLRRGHRQPHRQSRKRLRSLIRRTCQIHRSKGRWEPSGEPSATDMRLRRADWRVRSPGSTSHPATTSRIDRRQASRSHRGSPSLGRAMAQATLCIQPARECHGKCTSWITVNIRS